MKLNRFLAVLAAVLLFGIPAFAQTTATLTGTATLGGNPLPGATVTISSPNLQGTRTAVTDANGNYNFGALPPGDYTVRFEMESMTPVTKTVRVGLATTSRADAEMKLSAVAEAITVTASAPAVLETTEVQTNITSALVNELPLARDLRGTVSLAPGVTNNGPGNNQVISGAPSYDNLYLIDGATVNENLRGQPHDLYIEDAIQETTILTGAISAEYGRFSGGVVTAVSKSGGNEFSGTFRDSLQAAKWSALSPVEPGGTNTFNRGKNINQTYEATLGGRIIRDRLWFFTAGRYFKRNNPQPLFFAPGFGSQVQVNGGRKQDRFEVKLTGQITPKHSITGSTLSIRDTQTNNPFPAFGSTVEASAIDAERKTPNSFLTAHYNGVFTNSFLLEVNAAKKKFTFIGSGGDALGDFVNGTNVFDYVLRSTGVALGAPTFCGICPSEHRDNKNWTVKGTYYLSTKSLGTHNVVAGYDDWHQKRVSDNHQSASDFTVGIYTAYAGKTTRDANGNARITLDPELGDFATIIWWPILQSSKGNDLNTKSLFLNDKWDFTNKLSFNVGGRYDKNQGLDSAHQKIADDSKFSPRLGLIYDVFANGRVRLNASYSEYVSAIADGNVADAASPAGSPSYTYYLYGGPAVHNATTKEFLQTMYTWFQSVGGTSNKDWFLGGKTNGLASIIPEPLQSPYVGEYTVGIGSQVGSRGFVRADIIHRNWKNFYESETNLTTGQIFDPLAAGPTDVSWTITGNDFKRVYNALQIQASYAPFTRLNIGGNYTYARLRGNYAGGETAGSGPVANGSPRNYPEYIGYSQFSPQGWLSSDQRHKIRAWASYDQPTPIGVFNFSLLQNYDSGRPYSLSYTIRPGQRFCNDLQVSLGVCTAAQAAAGRTVNIKNPGYVSPPSTATYFVSGRGDFRTDNITSTNLAVNWNLPPVLGKVQFYIESELRNAFNEHGSVNVDTAVTRARAFDPFREKPVEGVNYIKSPTWGKPINQTTFDSQGDYQLPRTFLISGGVKF
jgi:outer membrane receptor protein involved in Fe transport